ncbi:MAG TPA: histidine kinase dimerization/phospho-acceptor domain-containing protein, partial [Cyclobacteriaceae bacterium]|nr:histidine kinase dimerization/phospho-acceptor domain-containing protein [Cyclobacteriaceae bacterium]
MMNIPSRPREKGINPFFVLTVVFLVAVSAIGIAVAAIQVIEKLPDWQNHGIPVLTVAIAFGFLIALQQARIFHSKKITRRLEKEAKVNAEKIASQQNTISAQDEKLRTNDSKLLVAEDRFAKEKERADDAERTKNHFLATMSHGIRTPLNSVLGSSALLRVTDLTTEQREYAEAIRQGSDSLLAMLTDMFDFAKIESGKVRLIEKPQNLRQCIEDVLALFSATVFKNEIDIIYFLDSQVPAEVCVDALRLKQVLLTIIGTATKFTRSGEEICLIVKVIGVKGDRCTLGFEVKDSGIGIPFDEG